jgi:hypothetical protein
MRQIILLLTHQRTVTRSNRAQGVGNADSKSCTQAVRGRPICKNCEGEDGRVLAAKRYGGRWDRSEIKSSRQLLTFFRG